MNFWKKRTSDRGHSQGQLLEDPKADATLPWDRKEYYQRHNDLIRSQFLESISLGKERQSIQEQDRQLDFFNLLTLTVCELLETIRNREKINKERVTGVISNIVDEFMSNGGNGFILLSRTFTDSQFLSSHVTNSTLLTIGFSQAQGFSKKDLMEIALCSIFHDTGMVEFDDYVQAPGRIDPRTFDKIRQHPLISADIGKEFLSHEAREVVLDVHEREQGQGYPRGKKGEDISPWTKIISICDIYEALTHPQTYRPEYTPFEAVKILIKMKNEFLETSMIKKWVDFISIYPIGSLVHLNTGEIAMVIQSNSGMPTRPLVNVILNEKRKVVKPAIPVDLAKHNVIFIKRSLTTEEKKKFIMGYAGFSERFGM